MPVYRFKRKKLILNLTFLAIFIFIYLISINYFSFLEAQKIRSLILKTEALACFFTLLTFLSFLFVFHEPLLQILKNIEKDCWLYMLILFIFAFMLRELIPPKTARLFFDEDIYLDMAKQIATHASSCLCDYGNKFECFRCELMKWPVGHPFLLSIPIFLFGLNYSVISHFMIFLSSLSVVFVFLSSYLLFNDKKVAIFSSLVLALLPVHILWSVTSSADVTFSFFISFLLFFSIIAFQSNDIKIHAISLLALALATQTKAESIILIPLYFLTQFINKKNYLKMFEKRSYVFAIILSFLLMFIYFLHVFYANRTSTWESPGEKFGFEYLKSNFKDNLSYWFESYATDDKWAYEGKQLYHPILLTLIACIGFAALLKSDFKKFLTLFSWFATLFLLYASFYAGSVRFGVDVRYVLTQYIPFSLICGYGFFSIFNLGRKKFDEKMFFLLLLTLLLIYFSFYVEKMHIPAEKIEEAYGARLYRDFAINFASKQPDDCLFISHVSSIYSWLGKEHMQIWYVYQSEFDSIIKSKSCVIFDEGYWCAIKTGESQSCIELSKKYKLELLSQLNDTKEGKTYSFYKVIPV
jgi:hypothetical protein